MRDCPFWASLIFPLKKNNERSIWRETKFLYLILITSFIDINQVIDGFSSVSSRFCVEKRQKRRDLQMNSI